MPQIKITIFGSYNRNSIGDKVILISLLDLLLRDSKFKIDVITLDKETILAEIKKYPWKKNVNIIPLRSEPAVTQKTTKTSIFRRIPGIAQIILGGFVFNKSLNKINVKNSDALIIGGGNLLMDMYPSWPIRLFILQRKFLAKNKPTYFIGVGAFPIKGKINSYLLKSVLKKARLIFVRDEQTQKFLKNKWDIENKSHPDLAFSYPRKEIKSGRKNENKRIAINAAPIFGQNWPYKNPAKYKKYIENFSSQLFQYYLRNKNVEYIFYETNYPTDSEAPLSIIQRLVKLGYPKKSIEYENKLNTVTELEEKIRTCDIAISTRLHAGILALKIDKPVICIAYQPKVISVFKKVGLSKSIVEIDMMKNINKHLDLIEKHPEGYKLDEQKMKTLNKTNSQIMRKILSDIEAIYSQHPCI
jgi:polysaccharide pyruvyl transferase WcaK-like protein